VPQLPKKMSKPPNPVIPFEEKIQNIVIRYEWEIFIPRGIRLNFSGDAWCHQHLQLLSINQFHQENRHIGCKMK
jgi:hypothetical protein